MPPVSALDVAAYILEKRGRMSAWKLQKLVYYCQAWSLVWDGQRLFQERIKAWDNGPVIPQLYQEHKGLFTVGPGMINGDSQVMDPIQQETVDAVLEFYGSMSGQYLSDLTHNEEPWQEAYQRGQESGEESPAIDENLMQAYYEAVLDAPERPGT